MQTRLQSLMEQTLNVGSGFIVSLVYWQFAIVPQVEGVELTFLLNLWITVQFTIISVIRGYIWRRYFNAKHSHKRIHSGATSATAASESLTNKAEATLYGDTK